MLERRIGIVLKSTLVLCLFDIACASLVIIKGGRTSESITTWAVEKWASNQPPPEVYELTSQSVMDGCTEKQLCFISFLPHILDSGASGRNDYIATATAVGKHCHVPCYYIAN